MRILYLHADSIDYELIDKEIPDAENTDQKRVKIVDVLVMFTSIEKSDNSDSAINAINDIMKKLNQLKINKLLIYPYAHLSNDLATPKNAKQILNKLIQYSNQQNIETYSSPFGWNKKFNISVKGHPLAEGFRVIKQEKPDEAIMKSQKKLQNEEKEIDKFHKFAIIDTNGDIYEINKKNWRSCKIFNKPHEKYNLLKIFIRNEFEGKPKKDSKPKHIDHMKTLELLDYCSESDVGHMKWYPNGNLVKDLIMDYALKNIALKTGSMKIQNPLLYRTDVKEINQLQGEFHERDYLIEDENKSLVLRFASDPGAFPFAQKLSFSYKNTPVRLYEEAICFRKEQKGELTGLMRLRNFWMTDQHVFCKNETEGKNEFLVLSKLFSELMTEVIAGTHWVVGFELVEEHYEKYIEILRQTVIDSKSPALIKIMKEMSHYYSFKSEYQAIFADESNLQISTVQWDTKNGERFNIKYMNEQGKKVPISTIIHASSFGSIERSIAAILETALWEEKSGLNPVLPVWLAPEHVRLIPIGSIEEMNKCIQIAETLEKKGIRVGIDDRNLRVGKKVYESKRNWVPYIMVIGKKELEKDIYSVVIRKNSKISEEKIIDFTLNDLADEISNQIEGKPFRPLYIPRELSKRVLFTPIQ